MVKKCIIYLLTFILLISNVNVCVFAEDEKPFTGFGMEKLIKTKPLIYEDFENYSNGLGKNCRFSTRNLRETVFAKDNGKEYGKSLSFIKSDMIRELDEPIESGKYVLSFDVKRTETNGLFLVQGTINGTKDITTGNSFQTFVCNNGNMGYYPNSLGWSVKEPVKYEANTWYHVMMWMDFDNGMIYHYRDNKFIASTSMPKRVTSFWFCAGNGTETNVTSIDNVSLYKADYKLANELINIGINIPEDEKYMFSVSMDSENAGNVFTAFKDVYLDVTLTNRENIDCEYNVKYYAVDRAGDLVWKKEDIGSIKGNETVNVRINPEVNMFDRYTVFAEYTDAKTGVVICKGDKKFCVVNAPDIEYENNRFGVSTHIAKNTSDHKIAKELIDISGLGLIRDDWGWGIFEKQKGVYEIPENRQHVADYFENATNSQIYPLTVYHGYNDIYGVDYNYTAVEDDDLKALEKAAEESARLLLGKCEYFEFTNEIDFARQDKFSCEQYAIALQHFYRGIKKGNPDAKVVACCTNRADPDWIGRVMEAGGKGYCDAVSVHTYHGAHTPEIYKWKEANERVRERLKELGMEDIEIWTTEGNGETNPSAFTEVQQALNLPRLFGLCQAYNVNDRFIMYTLQGLGTGEGEFEGDFGILYPANGKNPYTPKLAYMTMCAFFARTQNAEFENIIQVDDEYLYRYKNSDGSRVLMLYTNYTQKEVTLDLGALEGTVFDMYGNGQKVYSEDGKFTFTISDEPIYFEYKGDKFEKCEAKYNISNVIKDITVGSSFESTLNIPEGATVEVSHRDNVDVTVEQNGNIAKVKTTLKYIPDAYYFWQRSHDFGTFEARDTVNISVKKDGKLLAYLPIWVEYVEPQADVFMTVAPYDDTNTKYWTSNIKITNNHSDKELSGKLTLDGIKTVSIDKIKPYETKDIKINLPYKLTDGTTNLIKGRVDFTDGTTQKFSLGDYPRSFHYRENAGTNILYLKKTKGKAPVIDGVIDEDEWKNYKVTDFDKSQVSYGAQGFVTNGLTEKETFGKDADYGGKADFSGSIFAQWDDDYLYMSALVYDDVHYNKEVPVRYYLVDCFYVTTMPTKTQRHDTRVDVGLSEFYKDNKSRIYVNWSQLYNQVNGGYTVEEGEGKALSCAVRKDNVTIYEARIPWERLVAAETFDAKNFNMVFSIRDYDTDRDKTFNYGGWYALID